MEITSERYYPWIYNPALMPFEPFISYEHWHRYRYAAAFVAGKAVLDIASGEGYGSAFLAQHAASVVGVDLHEQAVAHAREHYPRPNLSYLCGSAGAIPIAGEHLFDVVVSFETIEHLDAPTQTAFAAEVNRLLKPEGLLLVSTPNRTLYSDPHQDKNPYHLQEFTTAEFATFLENHFRHVRLLSQHLYPVSYIWNLDGHSHGLREYQMALAEERFQPTGDDRKQTLYVIAVCTNDAEQAAALPVPDSLLLDLSEVGFRGLPEREHFHASKLYVDTGAGFHEDVACQRVIDFRHSSFTVTYSLQEFPTVTQLRWDPLERRLCRLRIRAIHWEDAEGTLHRLAPEELTCNGSVADDGWVTFQTLDPMLFLPVAGTVRQLTIEGEGTVASVDDSLLAIERLARDRDRELQATHSALGDLRQRARLGHDIHPSKVYLDTGEGFSEDLTCSAITEFRAGTFAVTFVLGEQALTRVRWDPLERRLCRLRVRAIHWEDAEGTFHQLAPEELTCNGSVADDGWVAFQTLDPMLFLPVAGTVRQLTIEGEGTVASVDDSLLAIERLAHDREGELAMARQILQAREQQVQSLEQQVRTGREQLQTRERQVEGLTASLGATENELRVTRAQLQARERELVVACDLLQEARDCFALARYR